MKKLELTGKTFGKLTVIGFYRSIKGATYWQCLCECGNISIKKGVLLVNKLTKSCGCFQHETRINNVRKKYIDGLRDTRICRIWRGILRRCNDINRPEYKNYGGRGITVCNEWTDFNTFYEWALKNGYSDKLQIDRIDNDGNYCPENCRWATAIENQNHTRRNVITDIDEKTLAQLSREYSINYITLWRRWNVGDRGDKLIRNTDIRYKRR